ncbi:hypothetical protein [uncultured Clostridium sp.]|jgi:hypothetical protein|uniref:hypothetical protein n=1 Tax=uncultured Clostridium sp. TaxID=59620 RepID=UPI002614C2FD|nr:hypothetical protein [uncultured Clostridium sp.]
MSNCSCKDLNNNGKKIIDLVRSKGFENKAPMGDLTITCSCGEIFKMETLVCKCPKCSMTFGVTPCSSKDIINVESSEINY